MNSLQFCQGWNPTYISLFINPTVSSTNGAAVPVFITNGMFIVLLPTVKFKFLDALHRSPVCILKPCCQLKVSVLTGIQQTFTETCTMHLLYAGSARVEGNQYDVHKEISNIPPHPDNPFARSARLRFSRGNSNTRRASSQ
jgi:hypothetical protein